MIARVHIIEYVTETSPSIEAQIVYPENDYLVINQKALEEGQKAAIKMEIWRQEEMERLKKKQYRRNKRNIAVISAITIAVVVIISLI